MFDLGTDNQLMSGFSEKSNTWITDTNDINGMII